MFLISFERLGASFCFFLSKKFFALFFVFSFRDSSYVYVEPFDIVLEVFETIYSFSPSLDCVTLVGLFSDLLVLFSVLSILLKNPSTEYFIWLLHFSVLKSPFGSLYLLFPEIF